MDCHLEIQQEINNLKISLGNCKQPTHKEMLDLLNLISMVVDCGGGGSYNTLVQETHTTQGKVVYPIDSFHSISINVLEGSMEYGNVNFPAGTTRNVEFSTTNQVAMEFTVNASSKIFVEYLK